MVFNIVSFIGFIATTTASYKVLQPFEAYLRGDAENCWISAALAMMLGVVGSIALPILILG